MPSPAYARGEGQRRETMKRYERRWVDDTEDLDITQDYLDWRVVAFEPPDEGYFGRFLLERGVLVEATSVNGGK
jgi:hypothetical protein